MFFDMPREERKVGHRLMFLLPAEAGQAAKFPPQCRRRLYCEGRYRSTPRFFVLHSRRGFPPPFLHDVTFSRHRQADWQPRRSKTSRQLHQRRAMPTGLPSPQWPTMPAYAGFNDSRKARAPMLPDFHRPEHCLFPMQCHVSLRKKSPPFGLYILVLTARKMTHAAK